ncbi:hypothetical protein [Marinobacter sp.]|uniref:hypothetical protein n=1 Tax=Marinobacter sp. TaxID=50741 RepID=UPI003563DF6A
MFNSNPNPYPRLRAMSAMVLTPLLLLGGCGDDGSSSDSQETQTGTFTDSPVSGLA